MPGARVSARLLAIIGAFDDAHRVLNLTAIAERAQLTLPTAHRLVGELVEGRALERRTDGSYVVGPLLWEVGLLAPVQCRGNRLPTRLTMGTDARPDIRSR